MRATKLSLKKRIEKIKVLNSYNSLSEIQKDLRAQKTTCSDLVHFYLKQIKQNQHLNAFLEVFTEEALAVADNIDSKIKESVPRVGSPPHHRGGGRGVGLLAGMVLGIKDNLCYKDHKASASSKILEGFVSLYDATVVERLKAEDAIIIGRLNCDEFAMGSSNENSAYGNVLNPVDNTKIPGGSSGGAAAAVKAGLCLAALGTDTGGSIRQPASLCDVVGLKPTYGRVSRYGCIAYASSFDQIGPITRNIEDAALILEVIAGADDYDSTASSKPVPEYSKLLNFSGKVKVAFLKDCLENDGLDPEIKNRMNEIITILKDRGHTVEGVDFPYLDYVVPAYYLMTTAEASSNLARYDGIHYGHRSNEAVDLESTYKKSRTEGFGREVKRRIMLGTFVLSAGYYDAYYSKAQKVRRLIRDKTDEILAGYDFILLPTTPGTAPAIGEKIHDPIAMYLEDIFTVHANLTGSPAISIPMGHHLNSLPFGVQLIGKKFEEAELLSFSKYLMKHC